MFCLKAWWQVVKQYPLRFFLLFFFFFVFLLVSQSEAEIKKWWDRPSPQWHSSFALLIQGTTQEEQWIQVKKFLPSSFSLVESKGGDLKRIWEEENQDLPLEIKNQISWEDVTRIQVEGDDIIPSNFKEALKKTDLIVSPFKVEDIPLIFPIPVTFLNQWLWIFSLIISLIFFLLSFLGVFSVTKEILLLQEQYNRRHALAFKGMLSGWLLMGIIAQMILIFLGICSIGLIIPIVCSFGLSLFFLSGRKRLCY